MNSDLFPFRSVTNTRSERRPARQILILVETSSARACLAPLPERQASQPQASGSTRKPGFHIPARNEALAVRAASRLRSAAFGTLLGLLCLTAAVTARAEAVIAYAKEGAIYTASAKDGKNAKKVCRGDDPCISNDGRFIVYTRSSAPPAKPKRGVEQEASTRAIIVRELASGKETVMPADGAAQAYGAFWSPDDLWIAFNVYDGKSWEVAAIHPDGTGFHVLTGKLDPERKGFYLAGWNLHDRAVLAQNLDQMAQLDPVTGDVAWQRPVKELTGEEGGSSDVRCTISADGALLVSTRYVEKDEFKNLDGPSSYLVLTDLPGGKPRRATPPKFDASKPWLDLTGESVLLRGFGEKDVTTTKVGDGVKLKTRIYRYDIRSGKLTPLTQDGESPSASRG